MLMRNTRSRSHRTLIVLFSATVGLSASAEPDLGSPPSLHKVEFIKVEGWPCLQPMLEGAVTTLDEFRAAELRWLVKNYPGASTPHRRTEIVFGPVANPFDTLEPATIRREVVDVQPTEGPTVSICFDIGLQERKP